MSRVPIIIDADFDLSDIAAILVLLRDPAVDVRAITIAGTGLVHCQAGRLLTRYLIDELGSPDIPFGCGREEGGADAHPFPDDWRSRADAAFGLNIPPQAEAGVPRDAVEVLAAAVESSPSAPTIVALGPLTNLEDAFAADPTLADRVAGIHAMLGTIDAPGNVFVDGLDGGDPLEWNAYADPSAVAAVFATDVPISIVPLDATDDVPVPVDLADRLADDHQAGGADLMYESLIRNPGQDAARGRPAPVGRAGGADAERHGPRRVGGRSGHRRGRRSADPRRRRPDRAFRGQRRPGGRRDGTPGGSTPRRAARDAVPTGGLAVGVVRWVDMRGAAGRRTRPGCIWLEYEGMAGTPSGIAIVGVRPPYRWAQLLALLPTVDPTVTPPDWVVAGPVADDQAGTGQPVTGAGDLDEGTYGPVCYTGTWPDLAYTAGIPFQAGAGAVGAAQ